MNKREAAEEVIENAHAACPCSDATRGAIDVMLELDARELEPA